MTIIILFLNSPITYSGNQPEALSAAEISDCIFNAEKSEVILDIVHHSFLSIFVLIF